MASNSIFAPLRAMSVTTALVISVCVVDSVTIAYDGSLMGSLNVLDSYINYFNINTTTKAVNSAATYIGAVLIAPFAGKLIDSRGRKAGILISALLNILGAVLGAAAQNIAMFIAGRMIVGMGAGLAMTSAGTYVGETTSPAVRSFALGLYFTCWALGSFLAAGFTYGCAKLEPSTWAWRAPTLLQALCPIFIFVVLFFVPESPRWLAYNDRREEALDVLARINNVTAQDVGVQVQYQEIIDTMEYEKADGRKMGFREIVRTAPNRKRLFLALSIGPLTMLTGSNVITYYFGDMLSQAGITNSTTQLEINLILSAWQFVVGLTGSLLAERIGRRMLCLVSLGSCTAFFYLLGGLTARYGTSSDTSGIYGTVACIFLFLGGYSFGLTPLTNMYGPEVLSYNIRGTGMAMFSVSSKVCGIFVTMVFPYMFDSIGWKTYMVNASWNVLFWVFVYFYWVETKGRTLEEIDELFDGEKHSDVPDLSVVKDKHDLEINVEEVSRTM
ncbi:hexose transporter [Xylariaceae sp. FL0016]|nr:hexose transporter [Xylariaceae sp. FL0016]